jgi:PAS domain S-box-containing protein
MRVVLQSSLTSIEEWYRTEDTDIWRCIHGSKSTTNCFEMGHTAPGESDHRLSDIGSQSLPNLDVVRGVVEALYFREEQIGFVVFEVGPRNGGIYDALRGQISSALQGALLVAELVQYREHLEHLVEEQTVELTRSNAQLAEEIIERTRIEQVLRVSEEQYRLIAENVKDGIIIVQNGLLAFANARFAAITGHPPEQLVMTDPVRIFHDRSAQIARDHLTSTDHKFPIPRWQAEILTKDGRTIWTEIEQAGIIWNSQPALLLTIRDITDRKLREQRLEEERVRLEEENLSLKSSIRERYRFGSLMGKSTAMQRIYELIVSAATSDVNVIISRESGTGKELIAHTLHQISRRKAQAYVPVNCASIPETLFEREFFGHRKGAFTGADRDAPGLFDRAHRGTLFLDEVTELSPATQAKLLRVFQDGEYTPLGSTTPKQADVLIVAATNKDCQEEIWQGRLRKDFFYRIGVIEIRVPSLRERKDDLPLLIEHALEEYRQKQVHVHGNLPRVLPGDQTMLPGELVQALYTYNWPGNVWELQNVLQRYLATRDSEAILSLLGQLAEAYSVADGKIDPKGMTLVEVMQTLEKLIIADMLAQNGHRTGKTARQLGINQRTLQKKIKHYRLIDHK